MVFVCAHYMSTKLIKNPAVTHDRRGLNVSDLKRDVEPGTRCSSCRWRNFELIVLDRLHGAAGRNHENWHCKEQAARSFHLRPPPPGLRSSTFSPRMRLAGLLLTVSVRLRMFAVDARTFSRIS